MKRNLFILISVFLCIATSLPITAYAEVYNLSGTDISVSVDDTSWYVFTRDNIENNPELEELGVSYDTIYNILYDNEAYMDAILYYEDMEYVEMYIRKRTLDSGIANLSNYDNKYVLEVAKGFAKKQNAEKYSVYDNEYKFAKVEYVDSNYGCYLCEYVTVVNRDNYTLTFQSTSQFTDEEYAEIKNIVDSVKFNVDTAIKEKKSTSNSDSHLVRIIGSAVIGGVAGAIISIITKKKKKRSESDEASSVDTIGEK
ncbi:MAG: hypothetical protein PUC88_03230 [Clostridia bacterium]|nr:hypothetical protein [Clostridia bacterium]